MKNTLQKAAAGVLCCTMLFGMTACGQKPKTSQTTVPTLPQQTQSSLSAVQLQGSEELKSILDGIEDNVFPGTAGCTLTAVPYTVRLLDWCKTAGVSESELRTAVNGWLQGKKDPDETLKKLELIKDTYDRLMGDTAQELLDTAGCRTDSYPWPESCRQVMQTLLEAAGVTQ